ARVGRRACLRRGQSSPPRAPTSVEPAVAPRVLAAEPAELAARVRCLARARQVAAPWPLCSRPFAASAALSSRCRSQCHALCCMLLGDTLHCFVSVCLSFHCSALLRPA
ncbi:unnamed protein product, partial [Prorocentrum cordatum]